MDGLRATWLGCLVGAVALLPFTPQLMAEFPTASGSAILGAVCLDGVAISRWRRPRSRQG